MEQDVLFSFFFFFFYLLPFKESVSDHVNHQSAGIHCLEEFDGKLGVRDALRWQMEAVVTNFTSGCISTSPLIFCW